MTNYQNPWLVRKPGPAGRFRLYCFSYAGGNATTFARWQGALGPEIDVCAIQLPGRGARIGEACMTSFPELARAIAELVGSNAPAPFAFFGHSLGSVLGFEVARCCMRAGLAMPVHLFASGCEAPRHFGGADGMHLLPDDELIEKLSLYNGTPRELLQHRELMSLVLPAVRGDFALVDSYVYRPATPLPAPITVLAGRADPHVKAPQLQDWHGETAGACDVHWFDGDHFFIHQQGEAVLDCVRNVLEGAMCV
ncbi:MAG: alpha/beta fold hydrolase [Pseudomonadota bacterium]